jgi:hypothetical protein
MPQSKINSAVLGLRQKTVKTVPHLTGGFHPQKEPVVVLVIKGSL